MMYLLKKLTKLHSELMMIRKIQSIDSIQTYPCGTNEEIIQNKQEIKCINIIQQQYEK